MPQLVALVQLVADQIFTKRERNIYPHQTGKRRTSSPTQKCRICWGYVGFLKGKLLDFVHTPKTNMDTQNDGLEKVTGPFQNGNFWYLC